MKSFRKKKFLGALIFLCVFALAGLALTLLWNALLPAIISGVSAISYLQSLGIIVLSRLLFGGLGHFGRFGMHHHSMDHEKRKEFFEMHHKFRGMSKEEKAEFFRKRMNDIHDEGK